MLPKLGPSWQTNIKTNLTKEVNHSESEGLGALIQESDGNCRDGRGAVPRVPRELEQVEPIVRFFIIIILIVTISVIL